LFVCLFSQKKGNVATVTHQCNGESWQCSYHQQDSKKKTAKRQIRAQVMFILWKVQVITTPKWKDLSPKCKIIIDIICKWYYKFINALRMYTVTMNDSCRMFLALLA